MSSLYIVIPAYNESENIEKTIDQWYQVVERHNDEGKSRLVNGFLNILRFIICRNYDI